jgi:tRNA-2-methylthio-N6-dimethylallyladenosine synthase
MQGCNQHCTFCIVPHTRGPERSRTIDDIVAECHSLVANGVREVTLLGQIVTSYGRRDIPLRNGLTPFVQLLEAVNGVEGLERIRFTSPHPKGYGNDLVDAFGRLDKLCETAHLPVQSGSNRVLEAMHRGYTRERFLDLVARLRRACPDIAITTDLIAGFPGETEEDFEETLELARTVEFDNAFLFKYSPRKDTPAAAQADQVPLALREDRLSRLIELVNGIGARKLLSLVGQTVEILVEGPSRRNGARLEGRTRRNQITVFDGSPRHLGQLLDVRVTRASAFTLYADPAILHPD